MILAPTHVIGPNDKKTTPNNKFFKNFLKKKFILFPNIKIPIIDVRNISNYLINVVLESDLPNKKIILNDKNLELKTYITLIKNKKFYFSLKINLNFILIISKILSLFKVEMLNKSRLKYIEMNPIVKSDDYFRQYDVYQTIKDTKEFLSKN